MFWNQPLGAGSAEAAIIDVNSLPASPKNAIYRTPGGQEEIDFATYTLEYDSEKSDSDYISELVDHGFKNTSGTLTPDDKIIKYSNKDIASLTISSAVISITYKDGTTGSVTLSSNNFTYSYCPLYNYYAGDETTNGYSRIIDKDFFDKINDAAVYSGDEEGTSEILAESTFDAVCKTASATAAKVASSENYILRSGNRFSLAITNGNSAASAITLNVNGTGAKAIYINGEASSSTNYTLPAGTYSVLYDGTGYQIRTDGDIPGVSGEFEEYKESIAYLDDEETTSAVNDYTVDAVCTTAGNVADKIAFCDGYVLTLGNRFTLLIANENTYQGALTLNVNGTGAKPIYLNGEASGSGESNYLPAGTYEVVYGSTATIPHTYVYHIRTGGEIPTLYGSYKENAEKVTYLDYSFASRFYQEGDYIDNGVLRKATSSITTGYLISAKSTSKNVLGENITLGKEISLLEKRVNCTVNYEQTQIASKSYSVGDYVYIDTYVNSSDNSISPYNSFRKITTAISSGTDIINNSSSVSTLGDEISTLNSELTDNAVLSASGYKATGITSAYGSIVKTGKRVSINIGWSGSVSSSGAILNLPNGYKPAVTATGAHMVYTNDWLAGNCTIETDGKLWDSTTSGTKTKGVISIDYYIA